MTEKSLYEIELETPRGRQGLAAAAAAGRTGALLEQAFDRSGLSQDDLAEILGVSKGRVSQVLHGDGNLHIATVARFLDAMGFRLVVSAVDGSGNSVGGEPRRRSAPEVCKSTMRTTWIGGSGVQVVDVAVHHANPATPPILAKTECLGTVVGRGAWQLRDAGPGVYQRDANRAASAEEQWPTHV